MDHNGTRTGWVGHFDPPDEGKQACGMVWHPVIRPTGEVELFDLPKLVEASLKTSATSDPVSSTEKGISVTYIIAL